MSPKNGRPPRVVFLVPRRADNGHRDRLWKFCREWWTTNHPTIEIFEGHHNADEGKFNRSAAINRASKAAGKWDIGIILDSDVLIDPINVEQGILVAQRFNRICIPFRTYHSLSQEGSARIMGGWSGDWLTASTKAYWDSVSCVVVVSRGLWDRVGGFDERFVGWGFEDTAFACATDAVSGRLRLNGDLWHLWHPATPERDPNAPEFIANSDLSILYRNASHGSWDAMRMILTQPGGPLS